jgi:hypothetical protein
MLKLIFTNYKINKMGSFLNIFISNIKAVKKKLTKKQLAPELYNLEYIEYQYVYGNQSASDLILNLLKIERPCLIARFGTTELSVIDYFLQNEKRYCIFPENLKNNISDLSGFFPNSDNALIRFCCESIPCMKNIDALGVRSESADNSYFELERKFITLFSQNSKLFEINELPPLFVENPWTIYLENKKVLVIHPFEESIRYQYNRRELLFKNPKILPKFELKTIKAVQSLADSKYDLPFKSWFEALDYMCKEIDKIDFDVALIGAGAYGLFLGDYCKRIGKQAIHMGGAVQVLFGIKGKRWNDLTEWNEKLYNEYWISPLDSEKPKKFEKVEDGCYW